MSLPVVCWVINGGGFWCGFGHYLYLQSCDFEEISIFMITTSSFLSSHGLLRDCTELNNRQMRQFFQQFWIEESWDFWLHGFFILFDSLQIEKRKASKLFRVFKKLSKNMYDLTKWLNLCWNWLCRHSKDVIKDRNRIKSILRPCKIPTAMYLNGFLSMCICFSHQC